MDFQTSANQHLSRLFEPDSHVLFCLISEADRFQIKPASHVLHKTVKPLERRRTSNASPPIARRTESTKKEVVFSKIYATLQTLRYELRDKTPPLTNSAYKNTNRLWRCRQDGGRFDPAAPRRVRTPGSAALPRPFVRYWGAVGGACASGAAGVCWYERSRTLCLVAASWRRRCCSARNSLRRVVVKVSVCRRSRIR